MEKRLVLGAACAGVVLFLAGAAYGEEKGKEVTVTGVVEAAEEDDQGNATAVGIWDAKNFKWYAVGEGGKGKELLKLVGKTLKVTGTVTAKDEWEEVITVVRYEEVKPEKR